MCYCNDCQALLHYLKRTEMLDKNGGTEIIPAYPADIKVTAGKDVLRCLRLSSTGLFRFFTACCHTPIVNTAPNRPWAGIHRRMYTAKDPNQLDKVLGPIKASIMGKYAVGKPPEGVPQTFDFKGMTVVMPFILKGKLLGKSNPSPFFENGQAIVTPIVLTNDERSKFA